jgi:hypothetical protein
VSVLQNDAESLRRFTADLLRARDAIAVLANAAYAALACTGGGRLDKLLEAEAHLAAVFHVRTLHVA